MAGNVVAITSLSPASAPPADAAIRAVITLIWPYSSSTKQCALLLADPDFRLRNKKGQVRVRFSGASAEAVALGKMGIGDDVLLELRGATWVESGEAATRTPGRSVDGELAYAEHVGLQKTGGQWIRADGSRPQPVQEATEMPIVQNGGRTDLLRKSELGAFGGTVPIYSSPAFVRKSRLSGDAFGDGYDPFTEELDAEGPRKRTRMSFGGVGKWRLAGRTPSPEKEDRTTREADFDMDMDDNVDTVEAMAPPSLPRLQMPEVLSTVEDDTQSKDGPSTPNLRPVPSSTLPLPSPFPAADKTADFSIEANGTAAAAILSVPASTSQQSLGPSQSLPDTADPEDADLASPTGIYAHNGDIEGTYREHVAHPELLSDREEDEGLYEKHIRNMQEVGMRDEYNDNGNGGEAEVNEDDVEQIIDDMGEEPEDSSDGSVEEIETKSTAEALAVIANDDESPPTVKGTSRQMSESKALEAADERESAAAQPSPQDENSGTQEVDSIDRKDRVLNEGPNISTQHALSAASITSRKRNISQPVIPDPETPAKLHIGIFGVDGASDTTQSTPQSERERIMARTYDSLFGFSNSPAPAQSFVCTTTPNAGFPITASVETATGAALRSTLESEAKKAKSQVVNENQAPRMSGADGGVPAPIDTAGETEVRAGQPVQTVAVQEPLEPRHDGRSRLSGLSESSGKNDRDATDASQAPSALSRDDIAMSDGCFATERPHDDLKSATVVDQPASVVSAPAAILEAAIEGDVDTDANTSEALGEPEIGDSTVAGLTKESSTVETATAESLEIPAVTESNAATSSPQVDVIELDDSSGDEPEQEGSLEQPHHSPPGNSINDSVVPTFPGSPTEVDSDEENGELELYNSVTASPQAAVAGEEKTNVDNAGKPLERVIPETLQTQDAQSVHFDDSDRVRVTALGVAPEISQTRDPVSIMRDETEAEARHSTKQSQVVEKSAMTPPTQSKNSSSFHYFSFQSTTSVASDSSDVDKQTGPLPHVMDTEVRRKVSDVVRPSPAPEGGERQEIDIDVPAARAELPAVDLDERMSDLEPDTVDEDEEMSDAEAFSPASSVAQRAAIDAGIFPDPNAGGLREVSHIVDADEQMSDAEDSFASLSSAQQASLHMPDVVPASDDKNVSSNIVNRDQRHSERLGVTEPTTQQTLPMSPVDSQEVMFETQVLHPAPQLNSARLPPTPQLTQGDSLIKEVQIVVEHADEASAQVESVVFDPPSRHTRSSAVPTAIEHVDVEPPPLDPPSRHTRSSVEPVVAEASQPEQVSPDQASGRTRTSVEPTIAEVAQPKHVTPDPPSRHTRSSAEPTANSLLKTPARRSTRRSQTHSKISEEAMEGSKAEDGDTDPLLCPSPKTPVRKSSRKVPGDAIIKDAETEETDESLQKRSPAKKSLTSRLSNVPEVISSWFSPRRSTRLHGAEEGPENKTTTEKPAFVGLSTAYGYYTPLSNLNQKMNSQVRNDDTVDIIAIVTESTKAPERARAGPKDYFTCFKMWDPSLEDDTAVLVEIFRPWKATLPMAEVGDVMLLRGFAVKSRKRQAYMISSETSSWCVWRYAEHEGVERGKGKKRALSVSGTREEVKGPPVELGKEERDRVGELREAWEQKV